MSTIVYDAKTRTMAADTRAYSGSTYPIGDKLKIRRIGGLNRYAGSLVGVSSAIVGLPEEFFRWIENGANRDDLAPAEPSLSAILVDSCGEIFIFEDAYFKAGPIHAPFVAVGSGRKFAYTAMMFGASPREAIETAMMGDMFTGGYVTTLSLGEDAKPRVYFPKPAIKLSETFDELQAQLAYDPNSWEVSQ